jgi:hypothetical protein
MSKRESCPWYKSFPAKALSSGRWAQLDLSCIKFVSILSRTCSIEVPGPSKTVSERSRNAGLSLVIRSVGAYGFPRGLPPGADSPVTVFASLRGSRSYE